MVSYLIPCRRGCFQKQRTCHTEPCCQWTCQDFWWRCFLHRSSSMMDHAGTTWSVRAFPWSRQSSWCPAHAQLGGGGGVESQERSLKIFGISHTANWTQDEVICLKYVKYLSVIHVYPHNPLWRIERPMNYTYCCSYFGQCNLIKRQHWIWQSCCHFKKKILQDSSEKTKKLLKHSSQVIG